jgi:hypothetical protein
MVRYDIMQFAGDTFTFLDDGFALGELAFPFSDGESAVPVADDPTQLHHHHDGDKGERHHGGSDDLPLRQRRRQV